MTSNKLELSPIERKTLQLDDRIAGYSLPPWATRAERIERMATVSPAPVRVMAGCLLRIDARSAPLRRRIHRWTDRLVEVSLSAGRARRWAARLILRMWATASNVSTRSALVIWSAADRIAGTADRLDRWADRVAHRTSGRLDRLADTDRRVAYRIERTVSALHPANLLRALQRTLVTLAGLATMAAMSFTPQRSVKVSGRNVAAARLSPLRDELPPDQAFPVEAAPAGQAGAPRPTALPSPPVAAPPPAPPAAATTVKAGPVPAGKGMWIYEPDATEGGNVDQIVARARAVGLTHLYVRTGSSIDGFNTAPFLAQLLPAAHAGGLRVIGWDFPYLKNPADDIGRAVDAVSFAAPGGDSLDGFAADVEQEPGTVITPATVTAYSTGLRQAVGPDYPLIAVVPRPNPLLTGYPFAELLPPFDAVAPMIYWMSTDPAVATRIAFADLSPFHKPVIPVGQAYDGGPEGGPRGVPSPAQIQEFMATAEQLGAIGVSFWSWQAADQPAWDAIRSAPQFVIGLLPRLHLKLLLRH